MARQRSMTRDRRRFLFVLLVLWFTAVIYVNLDLIFFEDKRSSHYWPHVSTNNVTRQQSNGRKQNIFTMNDLRSKPDEIGEQVRVTLGRDGVAEAEHSGIVTHENQVREPKLQEKRNEEKEQNSIQNMASINAERTKITRQNKMLEVRHGERQGGEANQIMNTTGARINESIDEAADPMEDVETNASRSPIQRTHKTRNSTSSQKEIQLTTVKSIPDREDTSNLNQTTNRAETTTLQEEILRIKKNIELMNGAEEVINQHIFGPVTTNTTIIMVQVHKRMDNLRSLVASLEVVRGINETLVVFSHDFWDPLINSFVRSIRSFRVMQVFFPYSIQLHQNAFPGSYKQDCPWNATRKEASSCNGQPDSYGHYREPSLTQIKHHWWWKFNRVFESWRVTKNSAGWVVFLEEDHYLLPDFLHVLWRVLRDKKHLCPSCQVIALGNQNKPTSYINSDLISIGDWVVTQYNLGFAMDKTAWKHIRSCKELFCTYDDYNWDWTLQHLNMKCSRTKLAMIEIVLSRVKHIGLCGVHSKKKSCDIKSEVQLTEIFINKNSHLLFPNVLKVFGGYKTHNKVAKVNGGWGDLRDHYLCRVIADGYDNDFKKKFL